MAELKSRPGRDLAVIDSVSLVRLLHAAGLVNRHIGCVTTTKGVVIAHHERSV
ncbi:hypothetical protein [Amycolatopsis sp. lyj-23]|uniref:hypothetical protein n=1 Tax=Amycolatopsis sp. lyj-23 TaxID=2789283 RepID=UPI00397A12A7